MKISDILMIILVVVIGGGLVHFTKQLSKKDPSTDFAHVSAYYAKSNFDKVPNDNSPVYLYQGQFISENVQISYKESVDKPILFAQRMSTLVFDTNGIKDKDFISNAIIAKASEWIKLGNTVTSIQINLNTDAKNIPDYLQFIEDMYNAVHSEDYKLIVGGIENWKDLDPVQLSKIKEFSSHPVFELYKDGELIDSLENISKDLSKFNQYYFISIKNDALSKEEINLLGEHGNFAGILKIL